jgi:hypothetical protein
LEKSLTTMAAFIYRRATPQDYQAILRLQSSNYVGNLSEEERKEGFLSAQFTVNQLDAMSADLGIAIAAVGDDIVGCLCAFRREFEHGSPVVAQMLESYERARLEGKPLIEFNSYVYGPVCVARPYRRRGLLRGLYEFQKKDLAGRFDAGVALVARSNVHSLQAHVAGLGMIEAGEFEFNGNDYAILAFRMP